MFRRSDKLAFGSLVICALSGCWLLLRFAQFAHGYAGVRAYHVEAATTLFVALLFLTVIARPNHAVLKTPAPEKIGLGVLAGFLMASLLLYWPAVQSGFLSDDFVLLGRVEHGQFGAASTSLMRPLVLLVWGLLKAVHLGPSAFHLFNIGLHGIVAYFSSRLVAHWLQSRSVAVLAGLIVLTHPAAVEPVAWVSGAFDVLATTLVLSVVLVSRRYGSAPTKGVRFALFALAIASVMAKETAAVAAVLVGLDLWMRRGSSRILAIDATIIGVGAAIYSLVRLQGTSEAEAFVLTKYTAQRALFQTFGGLGQPWPEDVRATVGALAGLVIFVVLSILFAATASRERLRHVMGTSAWILVAIAPVVGWIMIGSQLEGTRYLYLALPAWAGLFATMAVGGSGQISRRIGPIAMIVVIALNLFVVRHQIGAWSHAAVVRDDILAAVTADVRVKRCEAIQISDLPDTVRGVYVFRNGASEALSELGVPRLSDAAPSHCQFHWDQTTRTLR